ncbi:hypothetical protein GCK32_009884, partial [Trichostrongylus colubriformis]
MVVTRSTTAARVDRGRRAKYEYTYAPRSQPLLVDTIGYKYIDSYLEYDCLMTKEELSRLAEHKYSAVDTSWLDEICMKYYWEWFVNFYPLWLAPNLITLIGLVVNLATGLVLSSYCPTARESAPAWAYALAALGLFAYQTLDATDGKQARRTGAASPLGELFDHGCDSISQVFITLNVAYAMRLGEVKCGTFLMIIISVSLFYCAHWSTYCTGQLRFSKFDVTEAQMTIILVLLVTSIMGTDVWTYGVLGYQLRHMLLFMTILIAIYTSISYLSVILTGGVGRNGSTVAGTSVLFPACPLLASIVPFCMIYSKSRSAVFDENITIFVLCFGAVAAKATNRLIVGHMSRSELVMWDWIYLGPMALMLNQYYDFWVCEKKLLIWVTCYTLASLFVYCFFITRQICYHMKIYCFKVPIKQELSGAHMSNPAKFPQSRCAYVLPRKNRSCRMLTREGQKYCGEHAVFREDNEDRIPCPNDPKHTVDRRSLVQHLLRCNSRVIEEQWIVEGMNAIVGETKFTAKIDRRANEQEISGVIEKLQYCYSAVHHQLLVDQSHCEEIDKHLEQFSSLSDSKRKHLIQQSSIIGHLKRAGLLRNDPSSCTIELGAGKAQLAYWMSKEAPLSRFLLVDRSGARNKYDNRALQENPSLNMKRLRCSIEHLNLAQVEMLKVVSNLSAVCKHFCGSATDAGIRCLSNGMGNGLAL